ncbi:oxidoreductase [Salinactinospora qingdaonensis]|uniref:Oxidoreductase n=1 Tax=Salinactinospora qingdaonensis TaxID=702744 RepID=A0ABP7F3R9_9ACTN
MGAAVEDTRAIVDRLLGHRVLRRRSTDVSMEALVRGARASAVLEGADVTLQDVRSGDCEDPRVKGALRVSGELGTLVETWPKAPRQVLARLHALAAADAIAEDALGRPRDGASGAAAEDPLGIGPPPAADHVVERIEGLDALLAVRTSVPALVVSAIVHAELLAVRPFDWGNGLVARAAERLTLIERGLDPKALVPAEVGHAELREEYGPALRGYLTGQPDGVGAWVRYCARAVAAGARDSLATCEALKRG